jgi:hypothetical protein
MQCSRPTGRLSGIKRRGRMKLATASRKARQKPAELDPYYAGDEAWHHGKPESDNPHSVDTEAYDDWAQGWDEAGGFNSWRK